jgi:hypothetical protein
MSSPRARRTRTLSAVAATVLLAACGLNDSSGADPEPVAGSEAPATASDPAAPDEATGHGHAGHASSPTRLKPLRAGEKRVTLEMPDSYTPSAPTGVGTDD